MWIIVLSVVIVLFIILNIIFPKQYHWPSFNKVYDAIPGPLCVPYFGNLWAFAAQKEDLIPNLINRLNKFRPVMKCDFLGFTAVYLTEPEDLEVILSSRQHITKGYLYEFIRPWLGDGLLLNTGKKWFDHRKILTPAFHMGILEQYVDIFNKNSNDLVEHIKQNLNQDFIEINSPISLCTLDIICETAMGTRVNALKGGQKEFVQAIFRMGELNQKRTLSPWLYRDWCFYISPTGFEQRKLLKLLHGFSEKVIKERKAAYLEQMKNRDVESNADEFGCKKKISFLDLMIHCSETENKMTEQEIREEVDTFMFEGHDTTQVAISWALYELAQNPEIQNKAYKELKEIFGNSDRNPTSTDLNEMKYLERVIKESLRKHPSVPLISRKLEEDVTIKNYVIPAGTDIITFIYYLHMDPRFYPEPEKFNPDRFLPEAFCGHHPYSYIPFSAGPRNCIGQKFAIMEEKIIISQILRNFEMISLDKAENVLPLAELVLRSKNDFKIKFRLRK